jgi:hypothetical protein
MEQERDAPRPLRQHPQMSFDIPRCSGDVLSECQHRNLLARMVAAMPRRIAAMIGGDDQEIVRA